MKVRNFTTTELMLLMDLQTTAYKYNELAPVETIGTLAHMLGVIAMTITEENCAPDILTRTIQANIAEGRQWMKTAMSITTGTTPVMIDPPKVWHEISSKE